MFSFLPCDILNFGKKCCSIYLILYAPCLLIFEKYSSFPYIFIILSFLNFGMTKFTFNM